MCTATVAEAARHAHISQSTANRYLADPLFRAALAEEESLLIDSAARRILNLQGKAAAVIEAVLDDPASPPSTRLRAAIAVFELNLKLRAVEERLTILEAGNLTTIRVLYDGDTPRIRSLCNASPRSKPRCSTPTRTTMMRWGGRSGQSSPTLISTPCNTPWMPGTSADR